MPVSITATTTPLPLVTSQAGRTLIAADVVPNAHCCDRPGSFGTSVGRNSRSTSTLFTAGSAARRRISVSASTRSSVRSAPTTSAPVARRRSAARPSARRQRGTDAVAVGDDETLRIRHRCQTLQGDLTGSGAAGAGRQQHGGDDRGAAATARQCTLGHRTFPCNAWRSRPCLAPGGTPRSAMGPRQHRRRNRYYGPTSRISALPAASAGARAPNVAIWNHPPLRSADCIDRFLGRQRRHCRPGKEKPRAEARGCVRCDVRASCPALRGIDRRLRGTAIQASATLPRTDQ